MPEKLLNIQEVAAYLGVSEEEVKRLVDIGEVPAYRIGGSFLRFRKEQIDAVRSEVSAIEKKDPERVSVKFDIHGKQTHPYTEMEKDLKWKQPAAQQFDYSFVERVSDFFYYNDFYIFCFLFVAILLVIIFNS